MPLKLKFFSFGSKQRSNELPDVSLQSLARINAVNADQPSNISGGTIKSGTIMQASKSQPQTFNQEPATPVPQKSPVVERIILDHTPNLEVDKFVAVAQSQCEREKNAIKRRYEEELQKLRAIHADHVNKLHKDAEKAMEAMKVKMREEFKASYDLEVVQPLQTKPASCEVINFLMSTNADSEQPDDNNGQPRRNSTNKNRRKSSGGGSASKTKKQPNDIPEVPPQFLASINPVNAEQPSSSRKGSTDAFIPTTSANQQTSQPSTSTNGPLGGTTITSGTIMQATTSQPQTFTPEGSMVVPKKSHVVETIILDHTPNLDLDIEVDRLVSVAQSQCEREKNAIKRRYEEELQNLRAINADHVNKLHKDAEKAMNAMKVKMREEFKASYDSDVVQPLQTKPTSCEIDGNRLRRALEEALAAAEENQKASEELQNQNTSLRDELARANEALGDMQELKDRAMTYQEKYLSVISLPRCHFLRWNF